jgi:hypothetical protein
MRKMFLGLAFGAIVAFGAGLSAETKTVTGTVVDGHCNTKMGGAKAAEAGHASCAEKCIRGGAPVMLVSDGEIYEIVGSWTANTNEKLVPFAGKKVKVTGDVATKDGKPTITATAIEAAGS